MSDKKLHILQHSLGVDEYGQGRQYRNHFVTGQGCDDYRICEELVKDGLMAIANVAFQICGNCYYVTETGKRYVDENSPKPPKLSRSKQRYQEYLNLDGAYKTFGDFLKAKYWKRSL